MTGFLVFHFMCAWDGSKLASDPRHKYAEESVLVTLAEVQKE
ncbi:hypothetical protein ACP70R_000181 [Stipagrostis hirtigluma subsp. patula]